MARSASPWFWRTRRSWYVNKDGQRHFLGDHPPDAPPPRKIKGKWNAPDAIVQAFHELMARKPEVPQPKCPAGSGITVAEVLEKYLDWCLKHRAARTYSWYKDHLQSFAKTLPDPANMPVEQLRPFHVVEWVDQHQD